MKQILLFTLLSISLAHAGPKNRAWKLHNRIAGVPPESSVQIQMQNLIAAGKTEEAAAIATKNPYFYNLVLKNWVKPWSNRDNTSRVPLNDYVTTVLGIIRDEAPFREVLYGDVVYTLKDMNAPNYSVDDNKHYDEAEQNFVDVARVMVKQRQSQISEMAAPAGVITSRAAGEEFYSAGTNRRVNRFTFVNYLCRDYEELHDTTLPDFRVRRDVERDPGGDSRQYLNNCVGCHAGQDALAGAFAHYDFVSNGDVNRLVYDPSKVAPKMNQNVYFKDGFITKTDEWINLWALGRNANLGWRGAQEGRGVASLGRMLSQSEAFSRCMASKVFKLVCLKDASNPIEKEYVAEAAADFELQNYNLKKMIVKTSAWCVDHEAE